MAIALRNYSKIQPLSIANVRKVIKDNTSFMFDLPLICLIKIQKKQRITSKHDTYKVRKLILHKNNNGSRAYLYLTFWQYSESIYTDLHQ